CAYLGSSSSARVIASADGTCRAGFVGRSTDPARTIKASASAPDASDSLSPTHAAARGSGVDAPVTWSSTECPPPMTVTTVTNAVRRSSARLIEMRAYACGRDPLVEATDGRCESLDIRPAAIGIRTAASTSSLGRSPSSPEGEGAFLACSFWLVDNYILQGRHAEARKLFDRLLSRCNDVGLLSEEFDPETGRMLGNFPQAYSHVGLINCALNLNRKTGPVEERAESERSLMRQLTTQ